MILKGPVNTVCYTSEKFPFNSQSSNHRLCQTNYSIEIRKSLGYKVIGTYELTRWSE